MAATAKIRVTPLPKEIIEIVADLLPPHGADAVTKALSRAARFGRFDIRSILAIGPAGIEPAAAGDRVVIDLPDIEVRSLVIENPA